MMNSVVYLTRRCPRCCEYCDIRDDRNVGNPLSVIQWQEAFSILRKLGVDFNLILGNEPWLLGDNLPTIVRSIKTPYALYTSCYPPLFEKYRHSYFGTHKIENFSAGIDFPAPKEGQDVQEYQDTSYQKSIDAWKAFKWVRREYPNVELHATITIHKLNYHHLPEIVIQLSELGININLNFIHWNSDGGFDFFPRKEDISHLMFVSSDIPKVSRVLSEVLKNTIFIQNAEMFEQSFEQIGEMKWHCKGDPYGGPTIDTDGTLRLCGYRKGEQTSKFTIFDLPTRLEDWKEAILLDASNCPGCSWSCPWMYQYWKKKDPERGRQIFAYHMKG